MKNNENIEIIRMRYNLSYEEIADIACYFSYIARDEGEDDTILCRIEEELSEED